MSKYKKFNIAKPEKYTKQGEEKTYWANIGILTEFTNDQGKVSRIIEIPAISLKANVFPVEPKEQRGEQGYNKPSQAPSGIEGVGSEIKIDSIPF